MSISLPARAMKHLFNIISSKAFLLWLIGLWIMYYIASAIFMDEAFAAFVHYLEKKIVFQMPFVLFLLSGFLNIIRSARRRWKEGRVLFFMRLIMPFGIMVFFTGFFISVTTRDVSQHLAGEGDIVRSFEAGEGYEITGIKSGLKDAYIDIDAGPGKGVFAYEPKLTVVDKDSSVFEIGAFPPKKIKGTYYHILDFGFAPGIVLYEDSQLKDEGYMPLRILPPGISDFFEVQPYPYRFLISMKPEKVVQKGDMTGSQYNLKNPVYNIRVFKGESIVSEGDSEADMRFDNLTIRFFEPAYWVRLQIVRDFGAPVIIIGLFMTAGGIPFFLAGLFLRKV